MGASTLEPGKRRSIVAYSDRRRTPSKGGHSGEVVVFFTAINMASKGRPYRTFIIDGFEVLVGRGDDDNDYLTFQVAEPYDLWLHVGGGTPGSHVVVRNPQRVEIPRSVVERAAELCAWYSKARAAKRVDVHFCRAGDVKKPRGAPPGLVELKRYENIRVKPTPIEGDGKD